MSNAFVPTPTALSVHVLQVRFLSILPRIELHGRLSFRHLRCADRRADAIAEMVALAWKWHLRLAERGKDATLFPSTLIVVKAGSLSRTTAPRTPSSRTSTLLPAPRMRAGMRLSAANFNTPASSATERGRTKNSAGPPTRKPVNGASGSSRRVISGKASRSVMGT